MKESMKRWSCGTDARDGECIQNCGGETSWKTSTGKSDKEMGG
jgi:hypothetical protein